MNTRDLNKRIMKEMDGHLKPNKAELEFLNLAYNKFYDIYEEIFVDFPQFA